jgi:hypothetical protein
MNWIFRSQVRYYLCWISVLNVRSAIAARSAHTACYSTPNAAIESLTLPLSVSVGSGYRVTSIQADSLLGKRWVIVASCDHPEWPALAVQTGGLDVVAPSQANQLRTAGSRSIPVVHVGDIVRLWRQEDLLRIEVAGVSEESGGLGQTIRVRLIPRNMDGQWPPEHFSGVVRGLLDVEMLP